MSSRLSSEKIDKPLMAEGKAGELRLANQGTTGDARMQNDAPRFAKLRGSPIFSSTAAAADSYSAKQQTHHQQQQQLLDGQLVWSFALPTEVDPSAVASHFPRAADYFPSTLQRGGASLPLSTEESHRFDLLWSRRVALGPFDDARHAEAFDRRSLFLRERRDVLHHYGAIWREKVARAKEDKAAAVNDIAASIVNRVAAEEEEERKTLSVNDNSDLAFKEKSLLNDQQQPQNVADVINAKMKDTNVGASSAFVPLQHQHQHRQPQQNVVPPSSSSVVSAFPLPSTTTSQFQYYSGPTHVIPSLVASHFPHTTALCFPPQPNKKVRVENRSIPVGLELKTRFAPLYARRQQLAHRSLSRREAASARYLESLHNIQLKQLRLGDRRNLANQFRGRSSDDGRLMLNNRNMNNVDETNVPLNLGANINGLSSSPSPDTTTMTTTTTTIASSGISHPSAQFTTASPLPKSARAAAPPSSVPSSAEQRRAAAVELGNRTLPLPYLNEAHDVSPAKQTAALLEKTSFFAIPSIVYPAYVAATFPSASRFFEGSKYYTEDPKVTLPLAEEEKIRFEPLWERRKEVCMYDDIARRDEADLRRDLVLRKRRVRIATTNLANASRVMQNKLDLELLADTSFAIPQNVCPAEVAAHFPRARACFPCDVGNFTMLKDGTGAELSQPSESATAATIPLYEEETLRFGPLWFRRAANAPFDKQRIIDAEHRRNTRLDQQSAKLQEAGRLRAERVKAAKKRREALMADAKVAEKTLKSKTFAIDGENNVRPAPSQGSLLSALNPVTLVASVASSVLSFTPVAAAKAKQSPSPAVSPRPAVVADDKKARSLTATPRTTTSESATTPRQTTALKSSAVDPYQSQLIKKLNEQKKRRQEALLKANPTTNQFFDKDYAATMSDAKERKLLLFADENGETRPFSSKEGLLLSLKNRVASLPFTTNSGATDNHRRRDIIAFLDAEEKRKEILADRRKSSYFSFMPSAAAGIDNNDNNNFISINTIEAHFPRAALAMEEYSGVFNKKRIDPATLAAQNESTVINKVFKTPQIIALHAADFSSASNNAIPRALEEEIRFDRLHVRRAKMAEEVDPKRFNEAVARGEAVVEERRQHLHDRNKLWAERSRKMRAFPAAKAKQMEVENEIRIKSADAHRKALQENRVWQLEQDEKRRVSKRKRLSASSETSLAADRAALSAKLAAVDARRKALATSRLAKLKAADKKRSVKGKAARATRLSAAKNLSREVQAAEAKEQATESLLFTAASKQFILDRNAIEADEKQMREVINVAAFRLQKEIIAAHQLGVSEVQAREREAALLQDALEREKQQVAEAKSAERAKKFKNLEKHHQEEQTFILQSETAMRQKTIIPAEAAAFKHITKEESTQRSAVIKRNVEHKRAFEAWEKNLTSSHAAAQQRLFKDEATVRDKAVTAIEAFDRKTISEEAAKEKAAIHQLEKEKKEISHLQSEIEQMDRQIKDKSEALGINNLPRPATLATTTAAVDSSTPAPTPANARTAGDGSDAPKISPLYSPESAPPPLSLGAGGGVGERGSGSQFQQQQQHKAPETIQNKYHEEDHVVGNKKGNAFASPAYFSPSPSAAAITAATVSSGVTANKKNKSADVSPLTSIGTASNVNSYSPGTATNSSTPRPQSYSHSHNNQHQKLYSIRSNNGGASDQQHDDGHQQKLWTPPREDGKQQQRDGGGKAVAAAAPSSTDLFKIRPAPRRSASADDIYLENADEVRKNEQPAKDTNNNKKSEKKLVPLGEGKEKMNNNAKVDKHAGDVVGNGSSAKHDQNHQQERDKQHPFHTPSNMSHTAHPASARSTSEERPPKGPAGGGNNHTNNNNNDIITKNESGLHERDGSFTLPGAANTSDPSDLSRPPVGASDADAVSADVSIRPIATTTSTNDGKKDAAGKQKDDENANNNKNKKDASQQAGKSNVAGQKSESPQQQQQQASFTTNDGVNDSFRHVDVHPEQKRKEKKAKAGGILCCK